MKIRFVRAYAVKDEEAKTYAVGDVVEMSPESAMHFVNRRAAVIVGKQPETATAKAPQKAVRDHGADAKDGPRK